MLTCLPARPRIRGVHLFYMESSGHRGFESLLEQTNKPVEPCQSGRQGPCNESLCPHFQGVDDGQQCAEPLPQFVVFPSRYARSCSACLR
jgi:hypothetical protein